MITPSCMRPARVAVRMPKPLSADVLVHGRLFVSSVQATLRTGDAKDRGALRTSQRGEKATQRTDLPIWNECFNTTGRASPCDWSHLVVVPTLHAKPPPGSAFVFTFTFTLTLFTFRQCASIPERTRIFIGGWQWVSCKASVMHQGDPKVQVQARECTPIQCRSAATLNGRKPARASTVDTVWRAPRTKPRKAS